MLQHQRRESGTHPTRRERQRIEAVGRILDRFPPKELSSFDGIEEWLGSVPLIH